MYTHIKASRKLLLRACMPQTWICKTHLTKK